MNTSRNIPFNLVKIVTKTCRTLKKNNIWIIHTLVNIKRNFYGPKMYVEAFVLKLLLALHSFKTITILANFHQISAIHMLGHCLQWFIRNFCCFSVNFIPMLKIFFELLEQLDFQKPQTEKSPEFKSEDWESHNIASPLFIHMFEILSTTKVVDCVRVKSCREIV